MENWERWLGRAAAVVVAALLCAATVGTGGSAVEEEIFRRLAERDDTAAAELIQHYLDDRPHDAVMLYNAACVTCRLNEPERAASFLINAVKAGFNDFSHMRRDPDLRPLHEHGIYNAILHARDAADPLLAKRQVQMWRERYKSSAYRNESDDQLHVNFVTTVDDAALDLIRQSLQAQNDLLTQELFGNPHRHYVLIALLNASDAADHGRDSHTPAVYKHRSRELITIDTGRSLRHEFVHVLHHSHMDELGQEHPLWIQEGLAALYEEYELSADGTVRFGPNDRQNVAKRMARTGELMRWSEVMAISKQELARDAARFYSQLRSFFRFMAERDLLKPWYADYTEHFDDDHSGLLSLERVFGRSMGEIDLKWRAWLDAQPTIVNQAMIKKSDEAAGAILPAGDAAR